MEYNDNTIPPDMKPQSKLIQALQIVFGRSPKQLDVVKGKEFPQEKYAGFDSIENRLSKVFTGYTDIQYDRLSKYRDYDRMDTSSTESQVGLDIYAEEASQKDDKTGMRVWIEADNDALAQELNGMLQRTRTEFKAYGLYRNLAKYGDCFLYIMPGGYGVHDYQFIHPSRIERVQQDGLLGFKSAELASHLPNDNKIGWFKPWDFLHLRITAYDQESVYGRSFLEPIRKAYKQLSMLETMLVLYRIAKAVQRNIFYVDVGQSSLAETTNLVKDYERFLKNKQQFIDPKTNEFKLEFNPATILQDIVWPVRPNSLSKVEQLQNTSSIGPLEDVDHFRNKIRTGLNIPKDYFDGEITGAWNSREALMLQDARFGRKITKLQDALREGIIRLCQIHWAISKGEYLPPDSFIVQLGTVSAVADRQREDILLRKAQIMEILANISVVMGWNRWVWGDYLLDEVFPLPAKLRAKLQTPDPVMQAEFDKQKELAATGGGGKSGAGAMKAVKPNKPPKKTTADNVKKGLRSFGYGEDLIQNAEKLFEEVEEIELAIKQDVQHQLSTFISEGKMMGFAKEELQELIDTRSEVKKTLQGKVNYDKIYEMNKPPEETWEDPLSFEEAITEDFRNA